MKKFENSRRGESDTLLAVLLEIRDSLRRIEGLLTRQSPVDDPDALACLLDAIRHTSQNFAFLASDLIDRAAIDVEQHGDTELRDRIVAVVGGLNTLKLGHVLPLMEGAGLRRIRNTRNGVLWKVEM